MPVVHNPQALLLRRPRIPDSKSIEEDRGEVPLRARHPCRGGRDRAAHGREPDRRAAGSPGSADHGDRPTGSSSSAPTSRSRTGCRSRPRSRRPASPSCPKLLGEIVRKLEPGPVTVAVTGDEAVITAGRFSTSLRLKPAEDFPRLASSDGQGVRVDAAAFAVALRQVVRARVEGRPAPDPHRCAAHDARRRPAPRRDRLVPARGARPQGREHAGRGPAGAGRRQGSGRSAAARRRRRDRSRAARARRRVPHVARRGDRPADRRRVPELRAADPERVPEPAHRVARVA